MKVEAKEVSNEIELEKVFDLRKKVFVKEQGVPAELELDKADKEADHVGVFYEDKAVGCGRIVYKGEFGKIGRVAVDSSHRRKGIGTKVLWKLINLAEDKGCKEVILHAQLDSADFYKKQGFKTSGEVFMEAGIKHIKMHKKI